MMDRKATTTASLLLQLSLRVHQFYGYVFVATTLALFVYKGAMLPYPPTGAFAWEIVFLILYYCINTTRLFQASKGNATRQVASLVVALLLGLPVIVCNVYYVQWQTYVLRLDTILNGIALFFVCWETLLCLLTLLSLLATSSL